MDSQKQAETERVLDISSAFVRTIEEIWTGGLCESHDGIVLIIDEIDTVAESTNIASFVKVTTERLAESSARNVAIYAVGVLDAIVKLKKDHPSVGRILETIELKRMSSEESREVIDTTLRSGGGSGRVVFCESVINEIIGMADGFPALIHQFCYYAYMHDDDATIDREDLERGVDDVTRMKQVELGHALRTAGSGDYRLILGAMASHEYQDVPLSYIAQRLGRESNHISSYMTKLVKGKTVEKIDRAIYKISDPLLRVYLKRLRLLEESPGQLEFLDSEDS